MGPNEKLGHLWRAPISFWRYSPFFKLKKKLTRRRRTVSSITEQLIFPLGLRETRTSISYWHRIDWADLSTAYWCSPPQQSKFLTWLHPCYRLLCFSVCFCLFIFVSYQEAHFNYEDLVVHFHDCRNFNIVAQALQVERPYFIYKEVNKENVLCVLCFKFFVPLICRCCLMPWCNMTIPHPQTWRRGQTERWRSTELLDWISRTTLSTRFFLSSSPVTE